MKVSGVNCVILFDDDFVGVYVDVSDDDVLEVYEVCEVFVFIFVGVFGDEEVGVVEDVDFDFFKIDIFWVDFEVD